jgi:hypothetical protein
LQSEATQQVATASAQGAGNATQASQQYLSGLVRNSQQLVELNNARAQVEAQNASRPTAIENLIKGGLSVAGDIKRENDRQRQLAGEAALKQRETLEKERAAAAKTEAEFKSIQRYTEAEVEVDSLAALYESENWRPGADKFLNEASKKLAAYAPTNPDEAKEFRRITQKISDTYLARNKKQGEAFEEELTAQRNEKAGVEKAKLLSQIMPHLSRIANGGYDEQASTVITDIYKRINEWRATDNGLPDSKKASVVASVLEQVNVQYGKKLDRYSEYQTNLRGLSDYSTKFYLAQAKRDAGIISDQELTQEVNELNQRYPGLNPAVVRTGDSEKLQLEIAQTADAFRTLKEKNASAVAGNLQIDNETIKSTVAKAAADPIFLEQIRNDPLLRDNPSVRTIVTLSDRLIKYDRAVVDLNLENKKRDLDFFQTQGQQLQTYLSLGEKINKGVQLSPQEQELQRDLQKFSPDVQALIFQGKQATVDPEVYRRFLPQFNQNVQQVLEAKQALYLAETNKLYQDYSDLANLGLAGRNNSDRQNLARNAPVLWNKARENINRLLLESQQQVTQPYGQQPNFNPSSTYAPVTDDKGKLVLAPRTSLQQLKVDGVNIVTPVSAGSNAPITSRQGQRWGRYHAGTDFAQEGNEKSVSLVSGTVVHVGTAKGYGGFVDILGDNGLVYRYAHQQPFVKAGQRVFPGQAISQSNGSGLNIGGDHLHLEVRQPRFSNGKYNVALNYGQQGTLDSLEHLKKLSAGSSNVLTPRNSGYASYRSNPTQKVANNSTLTANGGAINGQTYQRVGSVPGQVSQRFNSQRPVHTGHVSYKVNSGSVRNDTEDDLGYAPLRKDPKLRKTFAEVANRLGVPAHWLADIAAQESGGINPYLDHKSRNGNYGLFGFGNDSFRDKGIHSRLRAGKIDGAGQVLLAEKYLKENGWDKLVKDKGGSVSIADLWSFIRFGTRLRQKFQQTGDINIPTEGKLKYKDELKLLGKHVGRQYELPGITRSQKNRAVSNSFNSGCALCNQLAASESFAPHIHQLG